MAVSILVGVLSSAIAVLSFGFIAGAGLPETASVAMLAGGVASTCMMVGQS